MEIKLEIPNATRVYAVLFTDRLHYGEFLTAFDNKKEAIDYVDDCIHSGYYPPSRWNSTVEESDGMWTLTLSPTKGYEGASTMIYTIVEKTLI